MLNSPRIVTKRGLIALTPLSADYDGELVTDAASQECLLQAKSILTRIENILREHPEFGGGGGLTAKWIPEVDTRPNEKAS